jgi:hypothetical protein
VIFFKLKIPCRFLSVILVFLSSEFLSAGRQAFANVNLLYDTFFLHSATKAEVNALLDVNLEDAAMEGFVFDVEVARRAFDHFDKVASLRVLRKTILGLIIFLLYQRTKATN